MVLLEMLAPYFLSFFFFIMHSIFCSTRVFIDFILFFLNPRWHFWESVEVQVPEIELVVMLDGYTWLFCFVLLFVVKQQSGGSFESEWPVFFKMFYYTNWNLECGCCWFVVDGDLVDGCWKKVIQRFVHWYTVRNFQSIVLSESPFSCWLFLVKVHSFLGGNR